MTLSEARLILKRLQDRPSTKPSEDFPTSDEEMAKFLATHPKVEVPEKYKTPNWLFDKQPSEDLEEAAGLYLDSHKPLTRYNWGDLQDAFKAGAEWQKEQMMKDAVDYKIVNNLAAYPVIYYEVNHLGLKYGDKVKIIIVKKNEEET